MRRSAALECVAGAPRRALDLCCGTGDLAIELAKAGGGRLEVIGLDGCGSMLELAREKAERAGVAVRWVLGDAGELRDAEDPPPGDVSDVAAPEEMHLLTAVDNLPI